MTVPHKPCPWCGTVKHLSPCYVEGNYAVGCAKCGCNGPMVEIHEPMDKPDHAAWAAWDEFGNGDQWQDYEVKG